MLILPFFPILLALLFVARNHCWYYPWNCARGGRQATTVAPNALTERHLRCWLLAHLRLERMVSSDTGLPPAASGVDRTIIGSSADHGRSDVFDTNRNIAPPTAFAKFNPRRRTEHPRRPSLTPMLETTRTSPRPSRGQHKESAGDRHTHCKARATRVRCLLRWRMVIANVVRAGIMEIDVSDLVKCR